MPAFLDTSVIVRYLTGDPRDQADRAAAVVDGDDELLVTSVALAETAFVLTRVSAFERPTLVDALIDFVGRSNIRVIEFPKALAIDALLLCRASNRVSFADALIWAAARSTHDGRVYTFDQRFPSEAIDLEVLSGL